MGLLAGLVESSAATTLAAVVLPDADADADADVATPLDCLFNRQTDQNTSRQPLSVNMSMYDRLQRRSVV
jgi:hypothetical protein